MLKIFLRPAMIFIPLAAGFMMPAASSLVWSVRWVLVCMLYMVCLRLRVRELKISRTHLLILGANILLGVVPYLVLHFFCGGKYEQLALAAFFVGITPTATAAPVVAAFLNERAGFVLTGFVVTNAGIALALLCLLPAVTGNFSAGFAAEVGRSLFTVAFLPAIAAVLTRMAWKRAPELAAKGTLLSFALWSYALFVIAASARVTMPSGNAFGQIALTGGVSLLLCICNFSTGYLLAPRRFKREASQTLGQKNTALTVYLALAFAGPQAALGPIFYVVWHNSYNAFQMFCYDRRKRKRLRRQR